MSMEEYGLKLYRVVITTRIVVWVPTNSEEAAREHIQEMLDKQNWKGNGTFSVIELIEEHPWRDQDED